ncbi:MAG: hypothetical protein ABSB18_05390 [Candidatus Omnitrophota bacterium]
MEDKRSKGITNFGMFIIICALSSLFSRLIESRLTIYPAILAILLLILGIYILKLKEWARKAIIYYSIYSIISVFFIMVAYKLGLPLRGSDLRDITATYQTPVMKIVVISVLIITNLLSLLIIYFFTRPKVKEQFK